MLNSYKKMEETKQLQKEVINYFMAYVKIKGTKYWKICYKEKNLTKTYLYLGTVEKIIKKLS